MAYIEVSAFKKLKAFFWGLQNSGFNLSKIPAKDNTGMPIDKPYCLNLLHSFPDFQGEKFKDNNAIIDFLKKPGNVQRILDQFTSAEQAELTKTLEEKPVAVESVSEQPTGSAEAQQPTQGEPAGTMATSGIPQIPNFSFTPYTRFAPRPHNIPRAPEPAGKNPPSTKAPEATIAPPTSTRAEPVKQTTSSSRARSYSTKATSTPTIITSKSSSIPASLKMPSGISSVGKDFLSNSQIFLKKNLGKVAGGLTDTAKGVGRGIAGPMLTGAYKGLGKVGNGSLDAFGRLSSSGLRGASKSFVSSGSKKFTIAFIGVFLSLALGIGLINGISGTTPSGEAAPISSTDNQGSLNYTIPFRDSSIKPIDIKDQVKTSFPEAKLDYWDDPIIRKSIDNGWNPAFVLALWIEETGASHTTVLGNGGGGVPNSQGEFTLGHLGCAPTENQTIDESLNCLFKNFSSFTNNQFAQFMARYSGGPANSPFSNNPNFPGNLKVWYSRLVPSDPGALQTVTIATSQPTGCPVQAIITNPYGYNIAGYHYSNEGCGNPQGNILPNCHNGIDLGTSIYTEVKSTIDGVVSNKGTDQFKGNYIEITNFTSGFVIVYEHLNKIPDLNINTSVQKGTVIGQVGSGGEGSTGPHLHYKIKKDGNLINPLRYVGQLQSPAFTPFTSSDDISANDYTGAEIGTTNNFGFCGSQP